MPKKISLVGLHFGRLKVLCESAHRINKSGRKIPKYFCDCDCGGHATVNANDLRAGNTKSCGCLAAESKRNRITHGHSRGGQRTRAYVSWHQMLSRCRNPKNAAWHNYGGRGIGVCAEWNKFVAFLADMGEPPPGLTLERKDNNGPYCKENCCWATRSEQGKNTRRTRIFTVMGITACAKDLAKHFGIDRRTPLERIDKYGWTPHDAFTKPPRIKSRPQQ